ncbi:protein LSM12-like [Babylonia areolata]|uniref:protein LSM12-like n=1 Tax=Babylonia areolata TaxID=304850 RepID=UPI003FD68A6D
MKLDPSAMAEKSKDAEYFTPGSQVRILLNNDTEIFGEVVGFEHETRFLWIKRPVVGQHERYDLTFVNMELVANMEQREDNQIVPDPLPYVPIARVNNRLRVNVAEFRRQKLYVGENVSPEGQLLMDSIAKTIGEVRWQNDKIVVMECVMVEPPYTINEVHLIPGKESSHNNTTLAHIRKIVEKHQQDERSRLAHTQNNTRRSTSPSPSPAPSSSSTSSA